MTDVLDIGLPGVGLAPGDHICAFYFGVDERDAIVIPFLRAGLAAGDTCLCIVDSSDAATVLAKLRAADTSTDTDTDMDIDSFVASHRLDVRATDQAYLRTSEFSAKGMIEFFTQFLADAAEKGGHTHARIAGETAWALRNPPGADELFTYESQLNDFLKEYTEVIVCLYDLELFGGGAMVDMLRTHPKLLLGGMLIDNPHYLSPDEFLASRP